MDTVRIRFLREILMTHRNTKATAMTEFTFDDRCVRKPRFFVVPYDEQAQARRLYLKWGGTRREGQLRGTSASQP
jgi:hypothetical protein